MTKKAVIVLFYALLVWGRAHADVPSALPAYHPVQELEGELRIWGSPSDGPLLNRWAVGFRQFHPKLRLTSTLHGPDSTLAGIYSGVADLAFMAREMRAPVERMAFEWVYHHPAFSVDIANAGLNTDRPGANLAIMVHRDNPIAQITLTQLREILGAEQWRGEKSIRTWGNLGLTGAWKDRPIHVYGPTVDSIPAMFMRATVLKGSYKWNPDYQEIATDHKIAALLARDPAGIAYMPLRETSDQVKPLALSAAEEGPFVPLTKESVAAHTYPLARVITMVLNREPGKPVEARTKEFLRYVLSRDGQAEIARDAAYIPLSPADAQAQLDRLN